MTAARPQTWLLAFLAVYVVLSAAACFWAHRRGRLALLAPTLLSALLSLGLAALGGAVLVWQVALPRFLISGQALLQQALASNLEGSLAMRFGETVLVLEKPQWLLPIALCPWLLPGLFTSLTDMSRKQLVLQYAVRCALVCTVCAALSSPALLSQSHKLSVVALCDVSDSVSDSQLHRIGQQVEKLRTETRQRGDELHVVRFGAEPRLLPLPADGVPLGPLRPAKSASDVQPSSSNLQAAMQFAYGLFSPGTVRKMLLFSDGNQTEGDVLGEAAQAARRGLPVYPFPLLSSDSPEVLVRELRLSNSGGAQLKVGAPFALEVEVYSNVPQPAQIALLQNGVPNPEDSIREVHLSTGKNLFRFRSEPKAPGALTYTAVLEKPKAGQPLLDSVGKNNRATLSLLAKGKPRVLYIEGESAAKGYLSQALLRENIEVETRGPYGLPTAAKDFLPFDLVLLSDVPATLVGQNSMLALQAYVRDLGGGFVMLGGENSFGSGGYQGTQLEKLLPVRFEQEKKREQPSLAIALCIDRSASMNGPKLELAKDAARAAAEVLQPDDLISIVAFDSQAIPLVRLQKAQNRVRISTDIARLTSGGGTQLLPPLNEAYQQLVSANAKIKHVILLTDGQAEYQGIIELVDQMIQNKITVSTVGVGAGADQTLLTSIAEHGGGRFYFTQDASSVPKIFTKETTQVSKSALIEEKVVPKIRKYVELLDGVGIENAPALRGYVATKPKPLAEVILETPTGEPLLARWRQGLGQAVAYTSDAKNRWAVDWLRWPGYAKFFAQLVRSSMRHDGQRSGHGYDLQVTSAPPFVQVRVDAISSDDHFMSDLHTELEVLSPDTDGLGLVTGKGRVLHSQDMTLVAPGRYQAEFRLADTGAFLLRAVHRGAPQGFGKGPVVAESFGALSLPYPREYLALPPDHELLRQIANHSGGHLLAENDTSWNAAQPGVPFLRPLWPKLLVLATVLLLLDVLLRRLRLFGYRPLSL